MSMKTGYKVYLFVVQVETGTFEDSKSNTLRLMLLDPIGQLERCMSILISRVLSGVVTDSSLQYDWSDLLDVLQRHACVVLHDQCNQGILHDLFGVLREKAWMSFSEPGVHVCS